MRGKVALRPGRNDVLTLSYLRGQQIGASRYDQLNGGLGNLINRFHPQTLDFAVARYDRIGVPLFDSFSATLSYRVTELAYEHMNHPEMIRIEPNRVTAEGVRGVGYMTANEEKIPLLIGLLRHKALTRTIVFVNTKRAADRVWGYLEGNGFHAAILSELSLESGADPQLLLAGLLRHIRVLRFELARPSLHDIFVRIVRDEGRRTTHA